MTTMDDDVKYAVICMGVTVAACWVIVHWFAEVNLFLDWLFAGALS